MADQMSIITPHDPVSPERSPEAGAASPVRLRVLAVSTGAGAAARLGDLVARALPDTRLERAGRLADALRRLRHSDIDFILLEMVAAQGGLRVCARLLEAAPHLPLIVLAGSGEKELAREAIRLGAQDFLVRAEVSPERLAGAMACAIERNRRLVELRDLSLTDPLTGLYNRRGFALLADAHLRMLRRTRRQSVLIFADVDDLKGINDTYGHPAGDRAIVGGARLLTGVLRDSDIVARYGGDEFVALAHDASNGATRTLVHRIEDGLAALNRGGSLAFTLSLSIGAVSFGSSDARIGDVLARADRALYRDKRRARSQRPAPQREPAEV
jgi:diguanylate cyclase (GGDEF)-like protein